MKFIEFLVEGIVRRTSQHDKRTTDAINVIGKAISDSFRSRNRPETMRDDKLDSFGDTLITLAAFLEVPNNQPLDWFFQNRFDQLRILPKDRPPYSPHIQNALIYLAQRYNAIESEDEDNVQEWYYDITHRIEKKMNEGSHES
jgi:hypothetical protein